MILESVQMQAT
jgi:hypothetical protein